ncbi:MAG: ammonium transporter [Oscillatoriales cyanobacterium C42_A2020_001]|nr:ammonium transporter [Leptolyngbyaceae cyanobacterium C42_A2020_001]
MSKYTDRKKRERKPGNLFVALSSVWQVCSSVADVRTTKPLKQVWVQRIFAFCLPLGLLAIAGLLSGPLAQTAIAQAPAAEAPKLDTGDTAWMLMSAALVLFMTPGLAFFYGGLVRSRNVLNTMMMSLIGMGLVAVIWVLWGYSLSFSVGELKDGFAQGFESIVGNLNWVFLNTVAHDAPDPVGYGATIPHQVFMIYQMMFAIITVGLVSGAIVERMSFKAFFWFVILWITFIYCPLAHWVWGKGWLASRGGLDFAGGLVVHISSGVSALVAAWMLGPRKDWTIKPILPHNVPFVLLGVGMLWFGWFGFNAGSAIAAGSLATVAFVATTLSASAGGLAWVVIEWITKGKPTAIGIGSGFVAGLVGITPAAGFVTPMASLVIGAVTAIACFYAVNIKAKLQFDDSLDTFPIHGVGGTIGAILTGVFATKAVNSAVTHQGLAFGEFHLFLENILGVIVAYIVAALGTFVILKLLSLFMELRVASDIEDEGLDLHEHGEEAYGENLAGELSFAKKLTD